MAAMEPLDMQYGDDIFGATEACRKSLESCCKIRSLMDGEWAENRLADFNLWAAGIGASTSSTDSLDKRLMFHQEAKFVFLGLLSTLNDFAKRCKELGIKQDLGETIDSASAAYENSESSSDAEPLDLDELANANPSWYTDTEALGDQALGKEPKHILSKDPLDEAVANTESILDQLIKLGYAVRQSGTTARLQKADKSFNPDSQATFRTYLALILLAQVTDQKQFESSKAMKMSHTWAKRGNNHRDLGQLSSVQLKLIEANLRRRHRFNHARKHAGKLAKPRNWLFNAGDVGESGSSRVLTSSKSQEHKEKQGGPKDETSALDTNTTVTAVKESFDHRKISDAANSHRDRTVVSSTITKLSYPQPPSRAAGKRAFICPCCSQTLSEDQAQTNVWKKHIASDICPYTCPFPDCVAPDILYVRKGSWRNHIVENHGLSKYWECPACKKLDNASRFQTAESFIAHIRHHGKPVPEERIGQFADFCLKTELPSITICPLCKPTNELAVSDPEAALDHIGQHIHDFSLLSLPWTKVSVEPSVGLSEAKFEFVEAWLLAVELPETTTGAAVDAWAGLSEEKINFVEDWLSVAELPETTTDAAEAPPQFHILTAKEADLEASDDDEIDPKDYFALESVQDDSNLALRESLSSIDSARNSFLETIADPKEAVHELQLLDIQESYLNLMTDNGDSKDDVKVPETELGQKIESDFEAGKDLMIILSADGKDTVMGYFEAPQNA